MPSAKLSSLAALTSPQSTDLSYAVRPALGSAGSRSITNDARLSIITRNITDLSLGFQDGAGVATVSAANQAKIKYDQTAGAFQVSLNTAAYVSIATSA